MDPLVFRWLFNLTQDIQRAASLIGHTLVMQNSDQAQQENIQQKDQRIVQAGNVKVQEITNQVFSEKKEEQVNQANDQDKCFNIIDVRRLMGFQQYFKERKHLYSTDLTYREKMKKAGKEWKNLSFEEKSKYESLNSKVISYPKFNDLKQRNRKERKQRKQTKFDKKKEKEIINLLNQNDSLKEEK